MSEDTNTSLPLPSTIVRQAEPDADARARATSTVKEVYGEALKDTRSIAQSTLATRMIEQAIQTGDDSAARFILFQTAKRLAVTSGDVNVAQRAVDFIAAYYFVDGLALHADVQTDLLSTISDREGFTSLAIVSFDLIDDAIRSNRMDIAISAAPVLEFAAARSTDPRLVFISQAKTIEVRDLLGARSEHSKVLDILKRAPDDPNANLAAGSFLCSVRADWDGGLVYLSKGSDEHLRHAAQLDIAAASQAPLAFDAADAWWNARETQSGSMRRAVAQRAAYWYRKAIPQLSGLHKSLAEARLNQSDQEALRGSPTTLPKRERVILLCDATGSMMSVMSRARNEMKTKINSFDDAQFFNIMTFADTDVHYFNGKGFLETSAENKAAASKWIEQITAYGTTDLLPAVLSAIGQHPDMINIYTDGFDNLESPEHVITEIRNANLNEHVKINCIIVRPDVSPGLMNLMRAIAVQNGGECQVLN